MRVISRCQFSPLQRIFNLIATLAFVIVPIASGCSQIAQTNPQAKHVPTTRSFDVVVYGGTSGGVTAAVQAARDGKRVLLIEPTARLGGMTSAGLGWTDVGHPDIVGGLSREFYHHLFKFYENPSAWRFGTREDFAGAGGQSTKSIDRGRELQWLFEPHAAASVFAAMAREANVEVVLRERLDLKRGVKLDGKRIASITTEHGQTFAGRVFIDASYEGDLLAKAGVNYAIGREANHVYGETINGIQTAGAIKNQLPDGIDPYVIQGDPQSGLLPGVNPTAGGPDGAGDTRIQAYCFRMCLTQEPANRVMITKPAGYDEKQYELLFRTIEAGQLDRFFTTNLMPNRKTDSNNGSGLSLDLIGANYAYPEADYAAREAFARTQENWQRGLVWTLQHHPRVPKDVRDRYANWGFAKDEFADTNHWPEQMYVREARRMIGVSIATERTLLDDRSVTRSIGLGAYAMDSHNTQRYVDTHGGTKAQVKNEGDVQIKVPRPYRIDFGTIVPRPDECENLIVPVCVSSSHIAYGSIRMEPVFMILGQSAGEAASLAIDEDTRVQDVDYPRLRDRLVAEGQVLEWTTPATKASQ